MPGSIQSIERAAAILRLLSGRSRRLGVGELAGELGLPKGTVHGILRTLQNVGFVEQDSESGKYHLGAALLHMGSSYLDGNELRTRALNWADSLAAPIQDRRGVTVGAIGISGPIERLADGEGPRSDLISYVRESARAVSRDLGAIPW